MSDLIRKRDVISAISDLLMIQLQGKALPTWNEVYHAIDNIPSAEPERKWIPVTEALPKDTEFVLLTIRRLSKSYNQTPFISVGYVSWNQSAWWCAHDGDCDAHNVEVLAWMPLPEPWKGNDEYATD